MEDENWINEIDENAVSSEDMQDAAETLKSMKVKLKENISHCLRVCLNASNPLFMLQTADGDSDAGLDWDAVKKKVPGASNLQIEDVYVDKNDDGTFMPLTELIQQGKEERENGELEDSDVRIHEPPHGSDQTVSNPIDTVVKLLCSNMERRAKFQFALVDKDNVVKRAIHGICIALTAKFEDTINALATNPDLCTGHAAMKTFVVPAFEMALQKSRSLASLSDEASISTAMKDIYEAEAVTRT